MKMPSEIYLIIAVVAVFSLIGLAVYKVIKSAIPDVQKVIWILAFIVFNVLAAIAFIIYHDYFLSRKEQES